MNIGDRVTFDDADHGPQAGRIQNLLPNISNGQSTAVVEVDFSLPGVLWNVPVVNLKPAEEVAA